MTRLWIVVLMAVCLLGFTPKPRSQESPVLRVMLRFTPHKTDTETPEARAMRLAVLARAIEKSADRATCVGQSTKCKAIYVDPRSMRALLITIGKHESGNFAQYVHEDRCLEGPDKCDVDKDGNPRAKSVFQMWAVAIQPQDDWNRIGGLSPEANELAAWNAAKRLSGARVRCASTYPDDPIKAAIAGFAGGCLALSPKKLAARTYTYYQVLKQLGA